MINQCRVNRFLNCRYWFRQPAFDAGKDYYRILSLTKTASQPQIKQGFYALAKKYHPDVNKGQEDKFKEINEAYEVM
jgi:DnaJ-class molecular chaperone